MSLLNQDESVQRIKTNILKEFQQRFPLTIDGVTFKFVDLKLDIPDGSFDAQKNAFDTERSLEMNLKGGLVVEQNGKEIHRLNQQILAKLPYLNNRGTYIIGGKETVFINRMTLMPGVFVNAKKEKAKSEKIEADVRTENRMMKLTFDTQKPSITFEKFTIDYSKKSNNVDVFAVLKILGASDGEIQTAIGDMELYNKLISRKNRKTQVKEVFSAGSSATYPGDVIAAEKIQDLFNSKLSFPNKSKNALKATIGSGYSTFSKDAILATLKNLVKEFTEPGSNLESDDIRFKEISGSEDLLAEAVGNGLDAWIDRVAKNYAKKPDPNASIRPSGDIQLEVKKYVNSNFDESFAEFADVPNPLALFQTKQKVTMLGKGGVTAEYASLQNRNIQDTAFGKIDPIETPQSGKMGLIQHLSKDSKIKDGKIFSSFYRVKNGVVDTSKVIDDIDSVEEYDEFIAFNDPRQLKKEGSKLSFAKETVRVRHQGTFLNVPVNQVTLIDKSPNSVFGFASALIPFVNHDDGARALMGANMQSQAMALENPEAPLVQSLSDQFGDKTVEEEVAEKASFLLKSPVKGVVTAINDNNIEITTDGGQKKRVEKLNYFTTGKMGGYINHVPVVKVGQKVKEGDLLADGWQSKNGQLALGKNALIAYMPFEGYNFEDGLVISESFANKLASEEIKTLEFYRSKEIIVGTPEAKKRLMDLRVSDELLKKLDANGIVKTGIEIEPGDVLVAAVRAKAENDLSESEKIFNQIIGKQKMIKTAADIYHDESERVTGYQKGKVIDSKMVDVGDGRYKFIVRVLAFKKMEIGDKVAGRHGNKGVISKILPDNEMPQTKDGKAIDLIFSPLAVPSRKNVGQLLEVHAGLIAMKKGMDKYKVMNFDPTEVDKVKQGLKEVGHPDGRMELINPATGKPYENKVTVGVMYINKLKHKAESKITARNFQGTLDEIWLRPKKTSGSIDGDRTNPQGIGGMEFWSLISGGAVENVHEMNTLKGDGAGDVKARIQIFNAIKKGMPLPEPITPQSFKVVQERLKGAGLNIVPLQNGKPVLTDSHFNQLLLQPMKKSDWNMLGMTKVENAKAVEGFRKSNDYAKGGLYDEDIFGENGDKWGKIELVDPVVNPMFMSEQGPRPYEALLNKYGIKQDKIKKIVSADLLVVLDPKKSGLEKYELIDAKTYDTLSDEDKAPVVDTGNSAIFQLLKSVNLEEAYKIAEGQLRGARTVDERSRAERQLRVLSNALDKGFEPTDYMFQELPVLPSKYRPKLSMGKDHVSIDGLTRLYSQFMLNEQRYRENLGADDKENIMDDYLKRKAYIETQKQRYKKIEQIIGVKDEPYKDGKGQEWHGILHPMSTKFGIFREKMQKKSQDYSGRAVIAGDPNLDLDQVGLPEDMVAVIFEPHIRKELSKDRSPEKVELSMKTRDQFFRRAAENVTKTHPVILNRQPSLHRHSMQAFYPVIRWNSDKKPNRTIGLNPLVTTGYNADYDGDTMPVFVPLSDASKKEAIEKLMPSNNLMNPGDNKIIMELKHEMQLGIYYMTRDVMPTGVPKEFKDWNELRKAFEQGKVKTYDAVRMNVPNQGMIIATAGKHLFNLCLPIPAQDYKGNIDVHKKKLAQILDNILYSNKPGMGQYGVVQALNKLKNLSFKVSTYSGMSISMTDFDPIMKKKEELVRIADTEQKNALMTAAEAKLKGDPSKIASGFIDAKEAFEAEKVNFVKKELSKLLDDKNESLLDASSDLRIMQVSGARAKASQLVAMGGVFGVGKSVTNETTRPILNSHMEGLSPDQFWDSSYDARKGIFDKSIATRDPGALTRKMWMANKQTVIVEHDCKDKTGVKLNMKNDYDKRAVYGRVLLSPVTIKDKTSTIIQPSPQPLTKQQSDAIKSFGVVGDLVQIRSPLTCKSPHGLCQLCYGVRPGDAMNQLVPIGEAVGSIAAQAVGEPSQQAIMRTFHVGAGNASANSFEQIQKVLTAPKELPEHKQAVLAQEDGVIENIIKVNGETTIKMKDGRTYELKQKPILEELKIGLSIKRGQLLTKDREEIDGEPFYHTFQNPHEVLRLRGINEAQQVLMTSLNDAVQAGDMGGVDKRHLEVMVSNMLGDSKIKDGGTSSFLPGSVVKTTQVAKFNEITGKAKAVAMKLDFANRFNVIGKELANDYKDSAGQFIAQKGSTITEDIWQKLRKAGYDKVFVKPVKASFEPIITTLGDAVDWKTNNNWVETVAGGDVKRRLGALAAMGSVDQLDNPLTRQIAGLKPNFGSGFDDFKKQFQDTVVGNIFL